jgi:cell division protein FtsW|tara:strand:+ start:18630 stop:19796 length:1167 start_codon:yes stop_codon:yes gene_type:complete
MNKLKEYINLEGDTRIWAVVFFLSIVSIVVVYSATGGLAYTSYGGNTWHLFFKHFKFLIVGLVLMYFVHKVPHKYFSRLGQLGFIIAIPILLYTVAFGTSLNDANRWITIADMPINTFEIGKIAITVFLARQLVRSQKDLNDLKKVSWKLFAPLILVCAIIFPANLSTAAMIFLAGIMLLYLGGVPFKYLALLLASILTLGVLVISLSLTVPALKKTFPRAQTWVNRVKNFSEDKSVNSDEFYQVAHAKIAIVNGGIKGRGPGKSTQRNVLPLPNSDYVYAILIEEWGVLGGFTVVFAYVVLLLRGKRIFNLANDPLAAYLGVGLSISLVLQAFINMAVAVDFFPVTGQTLPLISMGGVSVIFTCVSLGIILSTSRSVNVSKISANVN